MRGRHQQGQAAWHAPISTYSRNALQDRLTTLEAVREAGISVCAGGIIGLGEGPSDRVGLIHQLATLSAHPESVPINALVAVAGTPLGKDGLEPPTGFDMARCIATARVVMPKSMVRLSAGRLSLNPSDQVGLSSPLHHKFHRHCISSTPPGEKWP